MPEEPVRPSDDPVGRRTACVELIAQYYRPLYAYVRLLGHADADAQDVLQDTFYIVWQKLDDVRTLSSRKAWIYQVCGNAARASAKRARRDARHRGDGDAEQCLKPTGPDVAGDQELDTFVRQAVLGLSLAHRKVVVLHYFGGLSLNECGQVLGLPAGTVKSRLARALAEIKDSLIETGTIERSAPHVPNFDPKLDRRRAARPCP